MKMEHREKILHKFGKELLTWRDFQEQAVEKILRDNYKVFHVTAYKKSDVISNNKSGTSYDHHGQDIGVLY